MRKDIAVDTLRELLQHLIGQRLLDITGEDQEDRDKGRDSFCELMFENGDTVKFYIAKDKSAYKGGTPIAFSDPDKKDDGEFKDGYFHPTPEEREQHGWIAVDWSSAEGVEHHVVPTWGEYHYLDEACWCKPVKCKKSDDWFCWNHTPSE